MTDDPTVPLAMRAWELDRERMRLVSFNERPNKAPPWWVANTFDSPTGGWPYDHPLAAVCKAAEHAPHTDDCPDGCEEHDGEIPVADCRCGIYATRDIGVVSEYLGAATEPVLGIVQFGGRTIMAEPDRPGYARAQYARVAAILLIDPQLTVDHGTLRRLADLYRVPALVPHSARAEDYGELLTASLSDEAEQWLREQGL